MSMMSTVVLSTWNVHGHVIREKLWRSMQKYGVNGRFWSLTIVFLIRCWSPCQQQNRYHACWT